ncbi:hypothetical protein SAICODRAFT_73604 [Saitoella complicata NRRL Y-17804]|uniref:Cation/H+ exchanger transmembrane domain-containing protein n=1 Tax=Saitoella complicata (strain BCRC 22490 / CBS 7301 / JCM 7358 / NBRC 10748 / NRRL Y-17804) TaxID=698492 RepID=A0A0E9NRJ6_SAICN|nr:uncharacterized protein SAICODRAFT_73604 [Saitoella complicata NRRL Y-17804]ODQ50068.1 hypothetical protein SAICODRAFT_73604 [Saitoella complicata NRRL Y-17804]GAO52479.1 hypothetical protein G7K_6554-t1 [Saitoella complicata NRRL Y-17804]
MANAASLSYHEPGIVMILTESSFILLLNIVNFVLDRSFYCGLLGQVFLGVAWGTPGAKWLGTEAEEVIVQLGYLGLLLLVYEGGLSTSFQALKANLLLSFCVAITGIGLPMGISFVLQKLTGATPLQSFAAGAALCSTSLGTTFTVLSSSGLTKSRLGVVLTSAAMMDDVVGLVMVQIISNLGGASGASISAVTVVRPLLVSLAFAFCAPLVCVFVAKPVTVWLNGYRTRYPQGFVNRVLVKSSVVWVVHTLILIGCIAATAYAGTSNLFAAYIAGAAISWWDADVPHPVFKVVTPDTTSTSSTVRKASDGMDRIAQPSAQVVNSPAQTAELSIKEPSNDAAPPSSSNREASPGPSFSGSYIYEHYYQQPLEKLLRPFFFASIGFSIPITEMFRGSIVWKGVVYAVLMGIAKMVCGLWLARVSLPRMPTEVMLRCAKLKRTLCIGESRQTITPADTATSGESSQSPSRSSPKARTTTQTAHTESPGKKPRSLYPASILGCAMVARGEIGFLISSIAESKGIFTSSTSNTGESSDIFLVVTWAIVLCTILGPLAVGLLARRVKKLGEGVEREGRVVRGDVLGVWGLS